MPTTKHPLVVRPIRTLLRARLNVTGRWAKDCDDNGSALAFIYEVPSGKKNVPSTGEIVVADCKCKGTQLASCPATKAREKSLQWFDSSTITYVAPAKRR